MFHALTKADRLAKVDATVPVLEVKAGSRRTLVQPRSTFRSSGLLRQHLRSIQGSVGAGHVGHYDPNSGARRPGITPIITWEGQGGGAATTGRSATIMGTAEPPIGISPHWGAAWCENRCGVLHRPIRVFVLWYGVFSDAQKQTVRSFVASLSPNADAAVTVPLWWNINRLYYDQDGNHISQSVTWEGELEDRAYSKGKTLLSSHVEDLLGSAISSQQLPYDPRGVYFLLSDAFVNQKWGDKVTSEKFCTHFCGWHHHSWADNYGDFIYSWVGKADLICPSACIPKEIRGDTSLSPTGDPGMDGLVSVFAHEFAEATSSPFVSTWFDGEGYENADKCAWKFNPLATDASGIKYNLVGVDGTNRHSAFHRTCVDGRCGVLHRPIRVFVLWYGVFSDAQKQTVRSFVASLSPNADITVTVPLISPSPDAPNPLLPRRPQPPPPPTPPTPSSPDAPNPLLPRRPQPPPPPTPPTPSSPDAPNPLLPRCPQPPPSPMPPTPFFPDAHNAFLPSPCSKSPTVPLWWSVNRQYHDQAGRRVTETVTWGGETDDGGYSRGATLYDSDVTALLADAITSRRLPYNADGVYFVLSDARVAQASSDNPQADRFCEAFCGWHFFGSAPGFGTFISAWTGKADLQPLAPATHDLTSLISFLFLSHNSPPHPLQCPTSCIAADIRSNASLSPTGDPGMDGLVSVLAHELAEAAASPFVSTWFDSDGGENADKCSWTFAPIRMDPSEARYKLVGINGSKFLIQHNWDLATGAGQLTLFPFLSTSSTAGSPPFSLTILVPGTTWWGQRLQAPHPAQLGPPLRLLQAHPPMPTARLSSTALATPPAPLAPLPSTWRHKPSGKEHCVESESGAGRARQTGEKKTPSVSNGERVSQQG
ncbi:unnamed protein product [Closterium sp. Yama58-4]|nr:unnamed protein product [Closterium sp. Yama58-4]